MPTHWAQYQMPRACRPQVMLQCFLGDTTPVTTTRYNKCTNSIFTSLEIAGRVAASRSLCYLMLDRRQSRCVCYMPKRRETTESRGPKQKQQVTHACSSMFQHTARRRTARTCIESQPQAPAAAEETAERVRWVMRGVTRSSTPKFPRASLVSGGDGTSFSCFCFFVSLLFLIGLNGPGWGAFSRMKSIIMVGLYLFSSHDSRVAYSP